MELEKAVLERRSVRSFSEKPVEKQSLEELVKAGIWAPSAGNIQPWVFFCIGDPVLIQKIRIVSPGMLASPAAIICICSDQKKAFEKARDFGKVYALMDCAMAAQNIMLRAYDLNLGSCAVRSFNPEAVRELLDAPVHLQPELLITLGYPAHIPSPPKRNRDVIHWERYAHQEERTSEE